MLISCLVALLSSHPVAHIRTGELPRIYAIFTATELSYLLKKSATVSQSGVDGGYPFNPESNHMYSSSSARQRNGACEIPSIPINSVVTPCLILGS